MLQTVFGYHFKQHFWPTNKDSARKEKKNANQSRTIKVLFFTIFAPAQCWGKDYMEILQFIQTHWLDWLFAIVTTLLGIGYKNISARLKAEQKKNDAIAVGVQSLLRESIVSNYNKYTDKKYCPIYAKESIKKVYSAYHNLDGNDVATELYHKILAMPEERKEE